MTVNELISLLNKIENKDKRVEIEINQYTKRYPVAFTNIMNPVTGPYLFQVGEVVRIQTFLPEGMHVVTKKA